MDKILEQTLLYDFYGELLTEHQKQIYEDVVFGDYSLSEVAEEQGISRQGVHDLVKRCNKLLQEYESRLHLVERFVFYYLRIIFYGFLELSSLYTAQSPQLVSVFNKRIKFYCLAAVAFGTAVVFKIKFGYGAEIIRFVKVGFGVDYLVEILNGKHIVIIIKRIAPYEHYPVGVYLCCYERGNYTYQKKESSQKRTMVTFGSCKTFWVRKAAAAGTAPMPYVRRCAAWSCTGS